MSELEKKLKEIREREQAATPGCWAKNDGAKGATVWASKDTGSMQVAACGYAQFDYRNADFIAHSRTDVPLLLALVEEMRMALNDVHTVPCDSRAICQFCATRARCEELCSAKASQEESK